ncbi:Uncharacterized protein dnm_002730 [Desulfonema magnum]|uniref:Uncharacterized protein n=1 Tax=Desulfonema magnum TaxID=45655 RepID=A0A975BFK1_9BACT|nr:Uncharacterized protein dnm_002730 [Desulfonema magnum]
MTQAKNFYDSGTPENKGSAFWLSPGSVPMKSEGYILSPMRMGESHQILSLRKRGTG